jgi:hypothetical protein
LRPGQNGSDVEHRDAKRLKSSREAQFGMLRQEISHAPICHVKNVSEARFGRFADSLRGEERAEMMVSVTANIALLRERKAGGSGLRGVIALVGETIEPSSDAGRLGKRAGAGSRSEPLTAS